MANVCWSSIRIVADGDEGKAEIDKLFSLFTRIKNPRYTFGCTLRELADGAELKKNEKGEYPFGLRGDVCQISKESEEEISIEQEDAWSPNFWIWRDVMEKFAPHCEFYYTAEEPGEGIYNTNDPNTLEEPYYIDVWEENNGISADSYYLKEDGARELLQKYLNLPDEDDMSVLENRAFEVDGVNVHKYEFVSLKDYNY